MTKTIPENGAAATAKKPAQPTLESRLHELLGRHRQPEETMTQLAEENQLLRSQLEEVRDVHEHLRQEIDILCQPENYPCVITDVQRNGRLLVQAQISGMAPVRAEVHPEVDPDRVRVGVRGHLTKARNCLIDVSDEPPLWKEVGTMEEYLDDGHRRILVKHQEQQFAVTLAECLRDVPLAKGDRVGCDRDAGLAYAKLPSANGDHLFTAEVPDDDFSQLGGLESQIRQIKQAIDFRFKYPAIALRYKLPAKQGILLEGPPGNGKTRIARCVANYIGQLQPDSRCRFMSVIGTQDYSVWLGGSEANLIARVGAAQEAAKDGPVVLFFDEFDALGRRRGTDYGSAAPERILATLLGLLDDVQKTLANVVIMAATNRADQLDPGLTRPGRLDLKLFVPAPNRRAAEHILRRYLGNELPCTGAADELIQPLLGSIYSPRSPYAQLATVKLNDGRQVSIAARELISGAMLEGLVRRASREAAVREAESGRAGGVSTADLAQALDEELLGITSLLSPSNVKSYVRSIPHDAHPVDVRPTTSGRGAYVRM